MKISVKSLYVAHFRDWRSASAVFIIAIPVLLEWSYGYLKHNSLAVTNCMEYSHLCKANKSSVIVTRIYHGLWGN